MSAAFARWYEQHGAGLEEATARKVWNAAVEAAFDVALEASLTERRKSQRTAAGIDANHAAAVSCGARAASSLVFGLRA